MAVEDNPHYAEWLESLAHMREASVRLNDAIRAGKAEGEIKFAKRDLDKAINAYDEICDKLGYGGD